MKYGGRLSLLAVLAVLVAGLAASTQREPRNREPDAAGLPQPAVLPATSEYVPEIIGGEAVQSDSFPWVAAIVSARYHSAYHGLLCAGVLIDPVWILTAAHCVRNQGATIHPGDIEIVTGRANLLAEEGQRIAVRQIEPHPDFNADTGNYDIALIQLAAAVAIQPVTLTLRDPASLIQQGVDSTVVGWGTTTWSIGQMGTYPIQLQQASVPLVTSRTCQQSYRQRSGRDVTVTDRMLCAGTFDNMRDACTGDSGGPLLFWEEEQQRWTQLGIVSWGMGCAVPGLYGVYTNLFPFRSWIQDVTGAQNRQPPATPRPVPATVTPTPAVTPATGSMIHLPYVPGDSQE